MTTRAPKKPTKVAGKPKPTSKCRTATNSVHPQTNGSGIHQGNGALPVVEVQPTPSKPPIEKDQLGRFLPGNNGGPGRPPGSKNKLVEDFLADFHSAWQANGADALRRMVKDEPSAFVQAAVQLMPKDVLVEARGAGLVVVETPAAIKALLDALPDLGVLPLNGSTTVTIASDGEERS
jgi:hypothetical protein